MQLARTAETVAASIGKISLHDLIHDYCVRLAQQRFGDERALHTRLLEAYQRICPDGWWSGPDDGYFFNHLRDHLIAAGRGGELADLLHELRWLEAKNAAGLAFDLPHDFRDAMAVLSKDDARWRRLRLIDQALRRELHFIDRHREDYPQALFQCLWNNGWWYDCPAAAAYHDPPPGGCAGAGRRGISARTIGWRRCLNHGAKRKGKEPPDSPGWNRFARRDFLSAAPSWRACAGTKAGDERVVRSCGPADRQRVETKRYGSGTRRAARVWK